MKVDKQVYYHLHKIGLHDDKWFEGNTIIFDKTNKNEYLDYYDKAVFTVDQGGHRVRQITALENSLRHLEAKKLDSIGIPYTVLKRITDCYKESRSHIQELLYENLRATEYPHLPSRMHCIWVCDEEDVPLWKSTITHKTKLYKVELTGEIHTVDAGFLYGECMSGNEIIAEGHKYWQGLKSENPKMETLFEGEVKILEEIT